MAHCCHQSVGVGGFAMVTIRFGSRRLLRWGVVPAVLALGSALLCPGTAGASAAPRTSSTTIFILSGGHQVKAGGVSWTLSLSADGGAGTSALVSVDLTRTISTTAFESHEWSVGGLPSAAVASSGAGKWRIDPKSTATLPLFEVNVTFVKSSATKTVCKTGSMTQYHGTLSGTVYLATGFTKLGTIGSKTKAIKFSTPNTVTVDSSCVAPTKPMTCYATYSVQASGTAAPYPSAYAFSDKGARDELTMSRFVSLSKPKNASRFDSLTASEPAITKSGSTLKVTTSGSAITGSLNESIAGTSPVSSTAPCVVGSKKETEKTVNYIGGSVSDKNLTAHMLVPGSLTLGKHQYGQVVLRSYS
jgi:hypothetical protein